jgi:hypothetical protein
MPPRTDPRWGTLVDAPEQYTFNFLALKIFIQRVARQSKASPAARAAALDEVYDFFQKNERHLGADLATIFA